MNRRNVLLKTGRTAGALVLLPSLLSLVQACKSTPRVDWLPQFFSEEEAVFVASVVDVMLPRTSTPGALDVKVDIFLDTLVAKTYDEDQQRNVRSEIAAFNDMCKRDYGRRFSNLNDVKRMEVLQDAELKSQSINPSVWGTAVGIQKPVAFYRRLKALTVWAYCSSEKIGEEVLSYDPIPQEYLGCINLEDVGTRSSL